MNPVRLTHFWERRATVVLKSKAMREYLLKHFFFQLHIFLLLFGCAAETINGSAMPSLRVLHMAMSCDGRH